MSKIPDSSLPVPAILLAIGDFGVNTLQQVKHFYLRGNPKREFVTTFLKLAVNQKGNLDVFDLEESISSEIEEGKTAETNAFNGDRQIVFNNTINNAEEIRLKLEQVIYDSRIHESLIKAGWAEAYDVPINIYLVVDIKDFLAAGAFFPISCLLQDISENTSLCKVHTLINCAVFPQHAEENANNQGVEVYSFLLELDELFQKESTARKQLMKALNGKSCDLMASTIYLFDCHKEGTYVVKNEEQMQIMVGNALLALLEDDFARHLNTIHDSYIVEDQKNIYNSIGAVVIGYDPDSLQSACAEKLAHEFIENVVLSKQADSQLVAQELDRILKDTGTLRSWLEKSVYQIDPSISQVKIDAETNEFSIYLSDFIFSELDYEEFKKTSWVEQVKNYREEFHQKTLPEVNAVLNANIDLLEDGILRTITETIELLPSLFHLYPGGITNAQQILDRVYENLRKNDQSIDQLFEKVSKKLSTADQELQKSMEQIQVIFNQAPLLPTIFKVLPEFIRKILATLHISIRYWKQIILLKNLKVVMVNNLSKWISIQIQSESLKRIKKMIERGKELLDTGKEDYRKLENEITNTLAVLQKDFEEFPLGMEENHWEDVFRVPVIDRQFALWAFDKWYPDFNDWSHNLINKQNIFGDWRNVTAENLCKTLVSRGKVIYSPLWDYSLEKILEFWKQKQESLIAERPQPDELFRSCKNSAHPLIKPDFDAFGNGNYSSISYHVLIGKPEWEQFQKPLSEPDFRNWEIAFTSDPFSAFFIQVRHTSPLLALIEMTANGRARFMSLSEQDKDALKIINFQDKMPPKPLSDVDANDGEVVHKVFSWKFTPKGSGAEIEQSFAIDINVPRFEYYRRLPRLKNGWNRYAEEEMPEIRMLALEFQKLHANQKWSTYNQVFNILKFVQSCIPYSYDKDTTGNQEWPRYPIETIMEGTGDCEDVAILCAAITARLGFQTALFEYPSHMAFGVAGADKLKGDYVIDPQSGKKYYYGEATANGWHLGEIPGDYKNLQPDEILPVNLLID